MSLPVDFSKLRCAIAIAIAFCSIAVPANAAVINLNVDPTQSSLTLTGGAFGLVFGEQSPGSMVTSWSGSITADLTGGVFTFSGGSSIAADVNPTGPFTSAPNDDGTIAGNYGATANGVQPPPLNFATINGVYRNLILDITTGTAQDSSPMAGGTMHFDAGQLIWGAQTAVAPFSGDESLIGKFGSNTAGSSVSWDGTTLILPVLFQTTGGSGRVENWSGNIVARVVPEPSSMILLSISAIGLCFNRFRSRA